MGGEENGKDERRRRQTARFALGFFYRYARRLGRGGAIFEKGRFFGEIFRKNRAIFLEAGSRLFFFENIGYNGGERNVLRKRRSVFIDFSCFSGFARRRRRFGG